MKKILLSSFLISFCIAAMAQVKPASKQAAASKKPDTEAAQKAHAAHIAWKNKVVADAAKGINPVARPVQAGAAETTSRH